MRTSPTFACKETGILTRLKTVLMLSLLLAPLLTNCSWRGSGNASSASASALYDPPTITLKEGKVYSFKEGTLVGREDHKFHSAYSYRRAVIIGEK